MCIQALPDRRLRVRWSSSVARLLAFVGLSLVSEEAGKGAELPQPSASRPSYKSLRYEEDYRFLRDADQRSALWDAFKYVPIAEGRAGFLSFGGELRDRFEAYENEFFSTHPNADNAYLLQRYLLHGDYHAGEGFRIFGQLQGVFEDGRPGGPRPTDRGGIDIHQLFTDVAINPSADTRITLRAGRQELSYGSERLVSVREGTNSRRAFDAVRFLFKHKEVCVDAFVARPVEADDDSFDDQEVRGVRFWGAYATVPFPRSPGLKLDFYYLGLHNPRAVYSQGAGREDRHTVGMRLFGKLGDWDFNHEALSQFGRFGTGDIRAWSVATDHGYTFEKLWSKPRLGLKAAIASGDRNAKDADLQTLNPLFPRGNYFTEAALLGPQNFFDLHPCLRLQPSKSWSLDLGADFYWRESLDDGIYNPGGSVIYPGNPTFARFVGTDVSIVIGWQATRHLNLSAGFTRFFAGRFIRQNDGEDASYGTVWASYKF